MAAALTLVLSLLALGYLARRSGRLPDNAAVVLNQFVIDLCLPAAMLRLVPTLHMRWELATLVILPWLLAFIAFLLARVVARLLALDRASETSLFLCTALGNTSFLGYPLCSALLGESSLPLAAVYDQLGSFLLLSTIAPIAVARASGGTAPAPRELALRVLRFPPFIALLVALVPFPRSALLDTVLAQVSAALVPLAIFAVGLRLRLTPPRPLSALLLGLAIKLAVIPVIAYGLASLLDPPREVFQVAVLESAMPAMITAGAIAMAAGLAPELTAALVGWGVLVSLATVPLWAALVR
jgi:malate permease and related proteins